MHHGTFSKTAHGVAVRRAAHQVFDSPRVFDDPLALAIIGAESVAALASDPEKQHKAVTRAFRAFMAVRSRYAEDQMEKAVATGVDQYVVLGAGLDTFAYRNPHPRLRVFEVDHPATQAWKRERLQAAGIAVPLSLTFVAVDFEQHTLRDGLASSAFRTDTPAFFSWLGVIPYIPRESCLATLAYIAGMPPGSGVAFDFAVDPKLLDWKHRLALSVLSARVAAAGEPFQLFFDPQDLTREVRNLGFREVEMLAGEELNSRYFADRADGLRITGALGRLACAWV
jgi:methyltransferase (TIGR00027 family)